MNTLTKENIETVVKKHAAFAVFLAITPVVFIQLIAYFSGDSELNSLLTFISPIAVVGACAHFIKCVLIDLSASRSSNT